MDETSGKTGPSQLDANDYDAFAEAYAKENDGSLANAYHERPAMLALAGEVAGRSILDVGCGSGALSEALRERGASVTGIDASAGMLALARLRLGEDIELYRVDLNDPLPFDDGMFDDAIASLVLHYLEDWEPALAELRRVLRPGGRLLVSVDHPIIAYTIREPRPDYFATTSYEFDWEFGGRRVPMRFWRRSLQEMLDAFASAGFLIRTITEPQPLPEARNRHPEDFAHLSTSPGFLFFALES
ncbi:class I SAM-dependent methyltransferase [Brevibacterium sp. GP-SGM9]|uniref:class I SAM-dependent methyltransferase n=1 Tax=unclassified Brevibacterium TaxID=2614124 RepID=UPI001E541C3C|nr:MULTISPECIES: methyltransferase domain-containing protein [unclassified Brevibacterium]MCD1286119.1 SAM-dependent methyltransferase [Brevibacterium sp. CCUG 69071]MDK8433470.1 methyltransferase domain-containing protein [Brevibacterium sp. H-BE7]